MLRQSSLLVVLGVLAMSPAHAQTPARTVSPTPTGKIARVGVTGNVHVLSQDILSHTAEKVGDVYDPAAAQKDQAAIKGMGVFNGDIGLAATPDPAGGVDIAFTVSEDPVIKAIKFTANTPDGQPTIPTDALKALMQTREGRVLNTNLLVRDLDALFNHQSGEARRQGLVCDVNSDIGIDPKTGVLTIPLVETYIRQVRLEGSRRVPEERIRQAMRSRPGGLMNLNTLQEDVARIYGLGGFSTVGPYRIEPVTSGQADVVIPVQDQADVKAPPRRANAPSAGHTSTFSYTTTSGGIPIIPVRINDRYTAHLLLNTTANVTVISAALAATLGLTPEPMLVNGKPYMIEGKPASDVTIARMQFGGNAGIYAGGVPLPVMDMGAISAQAGQKVDGVLGFNSLSAVAVGIDFPRHRITFWDHGRLSRAERRAAGFAGAATAPLTAPAGDYRYSTPTRLENGAQSRTLGMSLGSASDLSLLPRAEAQALQVTPFPASDQPSSDRVRVPHVMFGSLALASALFRVGDGNEAPLLGLNVLSRFRILLDCPAQEVYLAPTVSVAAPRGHRAGLVVPFTYDPLTQGVPIIQVSVNGRPPLPFVFDSGLYAPMLLDRAAARRLGLAPNGVTMGKMNGSIPTTSVLVSTAVLQGRRPGDNVAVSLEEAPVADLGLLREALSGTPVAGIIGAGMLADTAVRLDFTARTLTFFPHPPVTPVPAGAVSLPLTETDATDAYFVSVSPVPGQTLRMLLDTGSWGTDVPFASAQALHPSASVSAGSYMLSSLSIGERLRVPHFDLGGLSLEDVEVTAVPVEEPKWALSTLGMDLLSRFRVTLDVPHLRLLLEQPPPPGHPPFHGGYSGVQMRQEGAGFRIQTVEPASPGAVAGLRAGDDVLSIDGRRLTGLRMYTADNLAKGEADAPAVFTINRAGRARTVRFRRLSAFEAPPQILLGLVCRRDASGPLVVKAVVPGCPADHAGIAPGDEITAINGLTAATITGERVGQLSHETHLTLTFRRPGEAAPRTVRLDHPGADRDVTAPKTVPIGG